MSRREGRAGGGRGVLGEAAVKGLASDALDDLLPPRGGRGRESRKPAPTSAPPAAEQAAETEAAPATPPPQADAPARPAARRRRSTEEKKSKPEPPARARLTADLSVETAERARNCVYWTPGLTLVALLEAALNREIARREKERGEAFPARAGELPTGRPVS